MKNPRNDDWISASEIGDYVFCSNALRLRRAGVKPVANRGARASGSAYHRSLGTKVRRVERARHVTLGLLMVAVGVTALMLFYWLEPR